MSAKVFLRKNILNILKQIFIFSHFLQEIGQKLTNIGDFHVCKGFFRKNIFQYFQTNFHIFTFSARNWTKINKYW